MAGSTVQAEHRPDSDDFVRRAGDDFVRRVDPYRRELLALCYRMLGSVHDAEDAVQETYLRAWRAYAGFEGRSSLRTWLYRIATTTCLTSLERRKRRPLPTGMAAPVDDPTLPLVKRPEVPWLEPVPDPRVGADAADPAEVVTARESVRLALVAALQHLPPRQRVVLVLRDVLGWRAAEVADLLGTTTVAANSSLQRARARLAEVAPSEDTVSPPTEAAEAELLDRWMAAFEAYDVPGIVALFDEDAVWEMPPFLTWTRGAERIGRLIGEHCPATGPGDQVLVRTAANGQPAFGLYMRAADGTHRAFQLQVLTLTATGVVHAVAFFDLSLFQVFGLPEALISIADVPDSQPPTPPLARPRR